LRHQPLWFPRRRWLATDVFCADGKNHKYQIFSCFFFVCFLIIISLQKIQKTSVKLIPMRNTVEQKTARATINNNNNKIFKKKALKGTGDEITVC